MGVQIYVLDRRQVKITIANQEQSAGTLRRFFKITEMNDGRNSEVELARERVRVAPAPPAAMLADPYEMPSATEQHRKVSAHLVLGWDADRALVTDLNWDYLPILGYAIRLKAGGDYVLHEERDGLLHPLSHGRAVELRILTDMGLFVRRGQATIEKCLAVGRFIDGVAMADCILSDGQRAEIMTSIDSGTLPDPIWYLGKRPCDLTDYRLRPA